MILRKNDSGRSIVEMLGVLAIMGVITVMGIQGYSQAIGKINRNNLVEDITRIAQEVRGLYAGRSSYNEKDGADGSAGYNIGTNLLAKMNYKLSSPYGGDYKIESFGTTGKNPGFSVSVENVPVEDCLYFTTMAWADVMETTTGVPGSSAFAGDSAPATGTTCPESDTAVITLYFR